MRKTLAALTAAIVLAPGPARAEVINEHPAYWVIVGLGTVGGLANSISAIVYAAQKRSFDTPWIVTTFISTAICAVWTGQLIYDAGDAGATIFNVGGAFIYAGLTVWPATWALVSSLYDAEPGEHLPAPEPTKDPVEALRPRSPRAPVFPIAAFEF